MERLPGQTILYGDYNMSAQVAEGNGYGSPVSLNAFVRSLMKGQNVLTEPTVKLMQTDIGHPRFPSYRLGTILIHNMGYGHNGERTGYLSLMAYDPLTDVSVVSYITLIDKTQGVDCQRKSGRAYLLPKVFQGGVPGRLGGQRGPGLPGGASLTKN